MTDAERSMTEEEKAELLELVAGLPGYNQKALLLCLREDARSPFRMWSSAFGSLSDEDAAQMLAAIEEAFEQMPVEP